MKLSKPVILLINTVVGLIGIILVLIGTYAEKDEQRKTLIEAIGTSLIATGGVNFLDKLLNQDTSEVTSQIEKISVITHSRKGTSQSIHDKKYSAKKIDIVGVSLTDCLSELANDSRMIRQVFSGRTDRLRLLFVHPNAQFLRQRALEDRNIEAALRDTQKESVEFCIIFFRKLETYYNTLRKSNNFDARKASLIEIKLIDLCPYITIERFDNETYWGLYISDTDGLNSPMFKVNKEQNDALFEHLKNHFKGLMSTNLDSNDNILLNMVQGVPKLNHDLAKNILGEDAVKKLLQQQS